MFVISMWDPVSPVFQEISLVTALKSCRSLIHEEHMNILDVKCIDIVLFEV